MSRKPKTSATRRPAQKSSPRGGDDAEPTTLKIVGGTHRGRKLAYDGDLRTRPMKNRVREAVFNLIGPAVKGKHVIDLFAGTGAIGLEALSRGAARATFLERHFPTADVIRLNAAQLELTDRSEVIAGDALAWVKRRSREPRGPGDETPLIVFVSPHWDLFVERPDDVVDMIVRLMERAAAGSIYVVEADQRFDLDRLPPPPEGAAPWDIREYPPATIAILRT